MTTSTIDETYEKIKSKALKEEEEIKKQEIYGSLAARRKLRI